MHGSRNAGNIVAPLRTWANGTSTPPLAYHGGMDQAKFAVLDVETTSGDPTSGRVMEVAILALDGNAVRLRWDTLVDPRRPVPHFIRKLTGINDAMVKAAPFFVDVVRTIQTLTEGRIIVAHNARFDMTALEHEFARTGLIFDRPTLCTERLTRQLVPHLDHYNLGSICRYFGISFTSAHRAMNDAEATASLFGKLLAEHGEERILATVSSWPRAIRA
ncbi:MAG TPA: 3'-5' exonuclease [Flavobacteriales bacterium]|nr:3'-5' exonuclease [Flavobacteriales bacterium]MBK7103179.1 3'-5' exonuclease [Flavobacteriales bacterium]MBK7112846.1 3'-5' exonuclease [Flavobacteriales bacterium]MBK8530345.1 3'-5' exonuclease [Flavobacteriales bacterium]HQW05138.1 3'-5' exonuclease [Flavobacteriales bacterium]